MNLNDLITKISEHREAAQRRLDALTCAVDQAEAEVAELQQTEGLLSELAEQSRASGAWCAECLAWAEGVKK